MWIVRNHRFGLSPCRRRERGIATQAGAALLGAALAATAQAAVIEFFNPDLDTYFITADPVEQDFVDTGAVGRWQRTGYGFATGGPNQVCRFGGNGTLNPATGTFFGPNSHFYTADAAECAGLKSLFTTGGKSWKFESNDFLTTPAINGGCPVGLKPIYRAYNNGFARGVDSNHRITSSSLAYRQTVAAGSIGEGVAMCAPAGPPPVATAVGVAAGNAAGATIGAAGGKISAADGKLVVTIPAGALAANTVIGIQPLTNLAPGRIGAAYGLTPEGQTFLKPVTLAFKYSDQDLEGTAADFLGAAFQTAGGYWQWAGSASVDTVAKTASIASNHFSHWAMVEEFLIRPAKRTVKTGAHIGLQVRGCYVAEEYDRPDGTPGPVLGADCNLDVGTFGSDLSVSEWSVNGTKGGGAAFGYVTGNGADATYTAPGIVPVPNPVAVSARLSRPDNVSFLKFLVVSNLTIADDSWTGTASGANGIETLSVDVTWTLERFADNVGVYVPSGTATMSNVVVPGCTAKWTPSTHALDAASDGTLTIDFNTTPPTYHGSGLTLWAAALSAVSGDCEGTTGPAVAGGPYFGGSSGFGNEASGTVSADGSTIEGSGTDGNSPPYVFNWKFTRNR
jgi:hypothetical protein